MSLLEDLKLFIEEYLEEMNVLKQFCWKRGQWLLSAFHYRINQSWESNTPVKWSISTKASVTETFCGASSARVSIKSTQHEEKCSFVSVWSNLLMSNLKWHWMNVSKWLLLLKWVCVLAVLLHRKMAFTVITAQRQRVSIRDAVCLSKLHSYSHHIIPALCSGSRLTNSTIICAKHVNI